MTEDSARLHVEDSVFVNNSSPEGGALLLARVEELNVTTSTFERNIAQSGHGSAIHVTSSVAAMLGNSFTENKCMLGAGTVYWQHDDGAMNEPHGLSGATNTFLDNKAEYGDDFGTEGVNLVMEELQLNVSDYTLPVPPFEVRLVDYYAQVVSTDSRLPSIITTLGDQNGTCHDTIGVVSGGA